MRASFGALSVIVVLVLMAVSFAAGLAARDSPPLTPSPARPTPTASPPRPTPSPSPSREPGVVAAAVVVPLRSVDLAAPITAAVERIFVNEEQEVREGQLLLRLDTSTRRAQVNVAEADVRRAVAAADRARVLVEQLPEDASQALRAQVEADLRLAEAEVGLAESALEATRTALRQTEVRAPFAGTVASLHILAGEQAVAGRPLLTIADMTGWLLETTDVSELDVVRVAAGDRAVINFAALPDQPVEGVVEQVRVRGGAGEGGVRFDIVIRPSVHLVELRWNMTASVRILPGN